MPSLRALVVGGSTAGLAAADGLRDGGWTGQVAVLCAEPHVPYDRSVLSKSPLLSDDAGEPPVLRSSEHLANSRIDLHLGEWAVGLDIDRRLVVTNNGDGVPYDVLIIATGNRPRRMLSTTGEILPVLRNLDDLVGFRRRVAAGGQVALIGAGFVGLEVAAALRARDIPVSVFGSELVPLRACIGDSIGRWLLETHRARGVNLRTGVRVVRVGGASGDYCLVLDDGTQHRAETVLVAVGAQPAADWLKGSGVQLGAGVLCDEAGRTSVEDVWAAGDVAAVEDTRNGRRRRTGHWADALEQGHRVGLNAARSTDEALPRLCSLWTEQYGRTLRVLGAREPGDTEVLIEGNLSSAEFLIAHTNGGDVHAITSCGLDGRLRACRMLLECGAVLGEFQALALGAG